jgi:hypothetical protein
MLTAKQNISNLHVLQFVQQLVFAWKTLRLLYSLSLAKILAQLYMYIARGQLACILASIHDRPQQNQSSVNLRLIIIVKIIAQGE